MKGKKVFVGLSGGVDSAVTAALLKQQGAEVVGVFAKGWYPPGLPCTWAEDRRDAMRVAAHLGIPFHTLDASAEYKKSVIDYMVEEYRAGRTPNPDVMCNREVKFGALYRFARDHGADYLATGHYAVVRNGNLYRGKDEAKDQSYFLWAVPKQVLEHVIFPLGEMEKSETRELAKKFKLPVAQKKDSQGICFLGPVSMDDFLRNEFGEMPGEAKDAIGKLIGRHDGVLLSTLGERITLTEASEGPWYVVGKDIPSNTLVVAHERVQEGLPKGITLTQTNWLDDTKGGVEMQYRYHGPNVQGTLTGTTFIPSEPLPEPIASGQSLVIYRDNECLGGGIIQ